MKEKLEARVGRRFYSFLAGVTTFGAAINGLNGWTSYALLWIACAVAFLLICWFPLQEKEVIK